MPVVEKIKKNGSKWFFVSLDIVVLFLCIYLSYKYIGYKFEYIFWVICSVLAIILNAIYSVLRITKITKEEGIKETDDVDR